jgi:EAL domain-containing protein (putative c-di-GMP-specific phosphodiesterase class I)
VAFRSSIVSAGRALVSEAFAEQRLRVRYQPIFDLRSGQPVRAEALVRIFDPPEGMRGPASFLEVAEETGLLTTIDGWVLGEAVQQAATWHSRFGANGFSGVGVNITARHLADARLATDFIEILEANGLPRDHLPVEVTERVLMEASNSAMTGLRALRSAGVRVGLDDFGTGYSSLAYLWQVPFDFVKVNGFVHRRAGGNPRRGRHRRGDHQPVARPRAGRGGRGGRDPRAAGSSPVAGL